MSVSEFHPQNPDIGRENKAIEVYYRLGIIDFLQDYSLKKQMETLVKAINHRKDKNGFYSFSAVEPKMYALRFYQFMRLNLFPDGRRGSAQSMGLDMVINQSDLLVEIEAKNKQVSQGLA
jgi:hypothetical protein